MTLYEVLDLSLAYQEAGAMHFMNIVTIFSAYLICAYLVGDKLTRLQITVINSAYSIFVVGTSMYAYFNQYLYWEYVHLALELGSRRHFGEAEPPPPEIALVTVAIIGVAYVGSLLFMYQRRTHVRVE